MKDKMKMVKVSSHLTSKIYSMIYLLMAIVIFLLVIISYQEHTVIDWVIFAVFDVALFVLSVVLRRVSPYLVMSDGEKL